LTEKLTDESLLDLYKRILPRLIERENANSYSSGKVSKWFSGIGQEAIQ
jgi:2-oxoisovalerate dehydrogenase E1 component